MKKIVQAADLGGAPIHKNDLRESFNDEIWDAIEALLSPFNSDTEGIIVSGCVITANASNFDMTAGIVYLNGEFMRIAAATNQTFTKYIAPSAVVDDDRQFAGGATNTLFETKGAELVGSIPGAGQYITINTLTGADDRRGVVTTGSIINGAVTTLKIADSNVTTAKIANLNVTTGKIADGAVTSGKASTEIYRSNEISTHTSDLDTLFTSSIQWIESTVTNIPASGNFMVITDSTPNYSGPSTFTSSAQQLAIQLSGAGVGDIYFRQWAPSAWGSWTLVNDASA